MNALGDIGNGSPQGVAEENEPAGPDDAAENIEGHIAVVGHAGGAGHGRAEGANDGDEARENHGLAAVFFKKFVGALQMAAAENEGILALIKRGARRAANPITDLIAEDGAEGEGDNKGGKRNLAGGGKNSRRHQQRITGKKKARAEAGLNENDHADDERAAPLNQSLYVVNTMEEFADSLEHAVVVQALSLASMEASGGKSTARERAKAKASMPIR